MNKSDFISDAVALDLGKSGVKVAETVEMQIGSEWWKLINSSEPMTLSVFDRREEMQPAVVGGVLNTSSMNKIRIPDDFSAKRATCPLLTAIFANGDRVVLHGSYIVNASAYIDTKRLQMVNMTTNAVYLKSMSTSKDTVWLPVYYDPIADVICIASAYNTKLQSPRYYLTTVNSAGVTVSSSYVATSKPYCSTDYYSTFSLPEAQEKAYSIFWTSGGSMKVKAVTHAVGDNLATKTRGLGFNSGAVEIAVVPTTALYSAGAYMFYLRQAESVGIAFLDSADSRIKYVLESESWATLHTLADMGDGNTSLDGFGTITTPLDGEFFVAHFKEQLTGNLIKPVGHSFPANMVINGFTRTGVKNFRMFGCVASTLYAYTLDPDTMTLSYDGIVTESWTGGNDVKPVMLASSGNLELIKFGMSNNPMLMLFNTETYTAVWMWRNWGSTTDFPDTAKGVSDYYFKSNGIWCDSKSQQIFLVQMYLHIYSSAKYLEVVTFSASELLGCTTSAEVDALFTAERRCSNTVTSGWTIRLQPSEPAETTLMPIENENYFIFTFSKARYSNLSDEYLQYQHVGVSTTSPRTCAFIENRTIYQGVTDSLISTSVQTQNSRNEYETNLVQDDNSKDGWVRNGGIFGIRYSIPTGNLLTDSASSFTASARIGTNTPRWRHHPIVCNEKGVALFLIGRQDASGSLLVAGTYYDGATVAGSTSSFGLSFIFDNLALDTWNNVAIATGAITGGEIPYFKIRARSLGTKSIRAISVRDGAIYSVDAGDTISGGAKYFYPCGSTLFWISNTGYFDILSTGAPLTMGMGADGSMEDAPSVTYHYKENTYIPYPFAREGIKVELSNISKTTKVTIPETQSDLIRTMLASGTDFRGSRCILRRLFPDHSDEGSDIILLDGYVQDWSYAPDKKGILFTVSKTLIDVGSSFPKRLMNMGCSHVFKGIRCGYIGEDGICTKTKVDCTSKGAVNNFGGFPWVAARQRRVMWR